MFLYYVAVYLLKALLYLFLILLLSVVIGRVYIEPVKGVCKCKTTLHGKVALVTGGNSGLGLETARDLARRGARVIIACRNEKKAEKAIEDITRTTGNRKVEFRHLNLFKPSSIREFAKNFNRTIERLDILINNAGTGGNFITKLAENGVECTMQVNYIGPFLLTNLLMDKLEASKPSRIVIVSSKVHLIARLDVKNLSALGTYFPILKYANSKLCNVLWTKALATRLPKGITANSLHPGFVNTDIFKKMGFFAKIIEITTKLLFKSPQEGAQTIIHLCVAQELEHSSGGYYAECKQRNYYRIAQDEELVDKLWEESVRLAEK